MTARGPARLRGRRPMSGSMRTNEILLCAALLVAFGPALLSLAEVWRSVDYYSHGFLVPLVALGMAMSHRARLARLPARRDPRGGMLIGLAGGIYLTGMAIGSTSVQGVALVTAIAGLVWLLRGPAWTRVLGGSIAYLLFMVPVPDAWLTPVIVKLQLFVSAAGIAILRGLGFSVFRDGNVIHLPGGESLFVAEACSGITSIVTLLPLAVFLATFTQRTFSRRLLLVATVVPLAMLGNLLRVTGTVVAVRAYGIESASGTLHDSAGILTYLLGCIALLGVGALMRRFLPDPPPGVPLRTP